MKIKPLRRDLIKYLRAHRLEKTWRKVAVMFERDIRYPSLHVELLEPRWRGIYSLRIDKKYRALFFVNGEAAEVFAITKHYKK